MMKRDSRTDTTHSNDTTVDTDSNAEWLLPYFVKHDYELEYSLQRAQV